MDAREAVMTVMPILGGLIAIALLICMIFGESYEKYRKYKANILGGKYTYLKFKEVFGDCNIEEVKLADSGLRCNTETIYTWRNKKGYDVVFGQYGTIIFDGNIQIILKSYLDYERYMSFLFDIKALREKRIKQEELERKVDKNEVLNKM